MINIQSKLLIRTQTTTKHFFNRYGSWIWKFGSAMADQGIFTITNFMTNVLLARWMAPNEYGAFVVAYAWYLLFQTSYEAVMLQPLAFYGPGKYTKKFKKYIAYTFYGHVGLSLLIIMFLGLGTLLAYFFDSTLMASALAGAALASPFMTLRELSRSPFYIISKPHLSALGGVVYFITLLPTVFILKISNLLTPFSALIGLGSAALLASLFIIIFFLKPDWTIQDDVIKPRTVLKDHWKYGVWSLPQRFLQWLPANIYYLVLPGFIGLEASGALRAITNLVLPVAMALSAMNSVLMPSFVRTFTLQGKQKLHQRLMIVSLIIFAVTAVYALVIILFGARIIHIVYDGQFDDEVTPVILIAMGLIPLTGCLTRILDAGLQTMGWVKSVFKARIIPTILTLTFGVYLTKQYGLLGANLGSLTSAFILLLLYARDYRKKILSDTVSPLENTILEESKKVETAATQVDVVQQTTELPGEQISVIMPTYNSSEFVDEAIQSILNQTYCGFELIIVDDGSTDNTPEIIQRYAQQDSRVRFIQNKHGGACKARNTAIQVARYPWIAIIDSDDVAMPSRLEKQLIAAGQQPEVILWGSYYYQINTDSKIIGAGRIGPTSIADFESIDRAQQLVMVMNSTTLFKKETFIKAGGYDERLPAAQDTDLCDRMANLGPVVVIPEPLMKYRYHNNSISAKKFYLQRMLIFYPVARNRARLDNRELTLEEYIIDYYDKPLVTLILRRIGLTGRYYYRHAGVLLSEGKRIQAAIALMVAIILNPISITKRIRGRLLG